MNYRVLLTFLAAVFAGFLSGSQAQTEDRLWVEATINGKPVHLAFDTGAGATILFTHAVARLGLSFTNAPKDVRLGPGEVALGMTEQCDLKFSEEPNPIRTSFGVVKVPQALHLEMDGVIGWSSIRDDILTIDAGSETVRCLTKMPPEVSKWTKFKLVPMSSILRLEPLRRRDRSSVLFIDTGDEKGIGFSPDRWRQWKAANTNFPMTLDAYYTPAVGLVVTEEAWAKRLAIGELLLKEVPIREVPQAETALGSVVLGLAALRYVDLIIDTKKGFAYLRPKEAPPPAYKHNRLGAVFTPANLEADDLIARVIPSSPAWEAGIRDGDVLMRIGELDVTKWRTDPAVLPLSRFWGRPPGTKLTLTLKRNQDFLTMDVVLRQMLPPEASGLPKGAE